MPGAWRQRTHKGHLAGPEPGSRPPRGTAGRFRHALTVNKIPAWLVG